MDEEILNAEMQSQNYNYLLYIRRITAYFTYNRKSGVSLYDVIVLYTLVYITMISNFHSTMAKNNVVYILCSM